MRDGALLTFLDRLAAFVGVEIEALGLFLSVQKSDSVLLTGCGTAWHGSGGVCLKEGNTGSCSS